MNEKVIRKPRLEKSNMYGTIKDCQKLYNEVKQWNRYDNDDSSQNKGVVYGMGWAISDLAYHGYRGESLKREQEAMSAVINACEYLQQVLEDVLGIESECYESNLEEEGYGRYKLVDMKG